MLAIFTVLHFLVDGICAAAMAAYAVQEPLLAPIVYYFGLYNAIAFGTQWLTGFLFDKNENRIRYAFLFVLVTLGMGTQAALGIKAQTLLLGIGNSVFHVTAGSLVLRRYTTYKELGIFVSSGAVGLALGLNCIVGPYPFLFACAVLCAVVTQRLWRTEIPEAGDSVSPEPVNGNVPTVPPCWLTGICLILLLGCIVLRGFGSGGAAGEDEIVVPHLFPDEHPGQSRPGGELEHPAGPEHAEEIGTVSH